MQHIRKVILAVLMALMLGTGMPSAEADHNVTLGHWPEYRWWDGAPGREIGAAKEYPGDRGFYVYMNDKTNPTAWAALNNIAVEWNGSYRGAVGRPGFVPIAADIPCDSYYDPLNRFSFMTICLDAPDVPANFGYAYYFGGHATEYHPYIKFGVAPGRSLEGWHTIMRHEMGHMFGLAHTNDCGALMIDHTVCGPLPLGRTWTSHDLAAVYNFYDVHPLH